MTLTIRPRNIQDTCRGKIISTERRCAYLKVGAFLQAFIAYTLVKETWVVHSLLYHINGFLSLLRTSDVRYRTKVNAVKRKRKNFEIKFCLFIQIFPFQGSITDSKVCM